MYTGTIDEGKTRSRVGGTQQCKGEEVIQQVEYSHSQRTPHSELSTALAL